MSRKLQMNYAEIVDGLAKTLLDDAEAMFGFEVRCTPGGKNKFTLCIKSHNGKKYNFSADNESLMEVSLDNIVRKSWPTLMLRPRDFISINAFSQDFNINKEDIHSAIVRKIKRSCNQAPNSIHDAKFWCADAEFYFSDDYDHNIYKSPQFNSFDEFLIWLDLNAK